MSLLHLFSFLSAFVLDELGFLSILLTADFLGIYWNHFLRCFLGLSSSGQQSPSVGGFKAFFL